MTLTALRDAWIAAENARTEAYRAFMQVHKNAPLRKELDEAEKAEKKAHETYRLALQQGEHREELSP